MKFISLVICLAFYSSTSGQSRVIANMGSFKNNKGVCRVCLFNNASSFSGKGAPVECLTIPIKDKSAQAVFLNIPPGTYAVSFFHDANNNNSFDTNFLGIPKEGYGASRNNLPFAAAPTFEGNKFTLPANSAITLTMRLRYL
jgi:uncharacterized protein (DUF2141 family)